MSLIGKRHPATANAFLMLRDWSWSSDGLSRGPRKGDVVTLSCVSQWRWLGVENATPSPNQSRAYLADAYADTEMHPWLIGIAELDVLHPLDAGARAALELVRR